MPNRQQNMIGGPVNFTRSYQQENYYHATQVVKDTTKGLELQALDSHKYFISAIFVSAMQNLFPLCKWTLNKSKNFSVRLIFQESLVPVKVLEQYLRKKNRRQLRMSIFCYRMYLLERLLLVMLLLIHMFPNCYFFSHSICCKSYYHSHTKVTIVYKLVWFTTSNRLFLMSHLLKNRIRELIFASHIGKKMVKSRKPFSCKKLLNSLDIF